MAVGFMFSRAESSCQKGPAKGMRLVLEGVKGQFRGS